MKTRRYGSGTKQKRSVSISPVGTMLNPVLNSFTMRNSLPGSGPLITGLSERRKEKGEKGNIKMCLFSFIVWVLLLFSIVVSIAIPSLNSYTIPIFLLTAFYTVLCSMSEDPLNDPEEPLLKFIAKNIVSLIFGILFVIGIYLAF